MSGDVQVFIPG